MKALFIVDDVHGQGHVVRSGALRDELERRGHQASLLKIGEEEDIGDVTIFDAQINIIHDALAIAMKAHGSKNVIIVDEPRNTTADFLIAGGAGATEEMYKDCGAKKVLAGPQYALLRPEFGEVREWNQPHVNELVDIRNLSGYPSAAALAVDLSRLGVVITYGGMRAMECACVGAPMVIVPRNEGERLNARAMRIAGAALIADEKSAEQVAKDLLKHPRWLQVMSKRGRELVDGLGVKRVADAIEELVK
jgi:spore coat polysaccharide biosynthesis predicted glycosyltransferase SpsG